MSISRIRYMRILVFFDLPVATAKQRKKYREFRKFLLDEGFIMMQESVYSKLAINDRIAQAILKTLAEHKPMEGLVQALKVTEKQYANIINITGKINSNKVYSTDEFLVL